MNIKENINSKIFSAIEYIEEELNKTNLLNYFEDYQNEPGYYKNKKGIYALYLKNKDCLKDYKNTNIYNKHLSKLDKLNEILKETNANKMDLFYIGETCDDFETRVIKKHFQGKYTTVNRKLYSYLKDCKSKDFKSASKEEVKNYTDWFNKNFEVRFYPIENGQYTDITIKVLETVLISMYNPPLNTKDCKD